MATSSKKIAKKYNFLVYENVSRNGRNILYCKNNS